jgi:hypothetical protein
VRCPQRRWQQTRGGPSLLPARPQHPPIPDWEISAAAAFLWCASSAFLPAGSQQLSLVQEWMDAACLAGAAGLGTSLVLIHIYVTFLKRTLQVCVWGGGRGGSSLAPLALLVLLWRCWRRWRRNCRGPRLLPPGRAVAAGAAGPGRRKARRRA